MANCFPASGLAYADAFSVGTSNSANSSLYVCSSCVQATRIEHIYSQTNLHHNTLWLRAMNSGARAGASIGFTVVNNGGDHHRANIEATANSGQIGGNLALYTRNNNGNDNLGIYIDHAGNTGINTTSPGARLDVCGADGRIQSRVESSDGSTINVRPNAGKCGWISYTEDAVADRWGIGIKNGDAKLYFASGNVGSGGGTTRMVLDGSGNLGINTTTPCSKLQISSGPNTDGLFINKIAACTNKQGVFISADDSVGAYIAGGTAPDGTALQTDGFGRMVIQGGTSEGFQFQTSTVTGGSAQSWTTRMAIKQSGNVGIGTTSPCTIFSITTAGGSYTAPDTNNVSNIYVYNSNSSCTTAHSMLTLRTNNSTGGNPFISFDVNQVTGWAMGLDNSDSDKFKLNWGWNTLTSNTALTVSTSSLAVGIGTSSPLGSTTERTLHLSDAGGGYATLYVTNAANSVKGIIAIASSQQTVSFGSQSNHALRLVTNDTTRMLINTGGCAGIGTTSPCTFLMIRGGAGGAKTDLLSISTTDGAGSQPSMRFDTIEANSNVLGRISTCDLGVYSAAMIFEAAACKGGASTATTEIMRLVGSTGNVGIATTSPSYKLHVNGTFYAAGSSIKYKEGICNYDTDSCLFMCLKPVTYQYKDEWQHLGRELKSQSQIGLIAEDVAEVMPELAVLVNEEDEKVVRNVDYEKLSVVLLKEVQKLRLEVDQLKNNK